MSYTITEHDEPVIPGSETVKTVVSVAPALEELSLEDLANLVGEMWSKALSVTDTPRWAVAIAYERMRSRALDEIRRRSQ